MTGLMLLNATTKNLEMGTSDELICSCIFFMGTQSVMVIAYIPMQVQLIYLVPENIETSTMALISGTFILSYEVCAKMVSTSTLCWMFNVDDEHMNNYPNILMIKLPLIMITMYLTRMIPTNEQIASKAKILREQHQDRLR